MGCTHLVSPQKQSSHYASFDWLVNVSLSGETSPGEEQLIALPEAPIPPHNKPQPGTAHVGEHEPIALGTKSGSGLRIKCVL